MERFDRAFNKVDALHARARSARDTVDSCAARPARPGLRLRKETCQGRGAA